MVFWIIPGLFIEASDQFRAYLLSILYNGGDTKGIHFRINPKFLSPVC